MCEVDYNMADIRNDSLVYDTEQFIYNIRGCKVIQIYTYIFPTYIFLLYIDFAFIIYRNAFVLKHDTHLFYKYYTIEAWSVLC